MVRKKEDLERLKQYNKKKAQEEIKTEEIFNQKIYHNRQYSVKIPKRFIDYIGFEEGDIIKFSVIEINKKPKLKIDYVRKNGDIQTSSNT